MFLAPAFHEISGQMCSRCPVSYTHLDVYKRQAKDSLLADLAAQRLKADPGAYSVYCNDGFTLAEILVERVSGQSFTPFLRQYIIGPLGLSLIHI